MLPRAVPLRLFYFTFFSKPPAPRTEAPWAATGLQSDRMDPAAKASLYFSWFPCTSYQPPKKNCGVHVCVLAQSRQAPPSEGGPGSRLGNRCLLRAVTRPTREMSHLPHPAPGPSCVRTATPNARWRRTNHAETASTGLEAEASLISFIPKTQQPPGPAKPRRAVTRSGSAGSQPTFEPPCRRPRLRGRRPGVHLTGPRWSNARAQRLVTLFCGRRQDDGLKCFPVYVLTYLKKKQCRWFRADT